MNSNLFWCVVGIIGGAIVSFIISLLFYFLGIKKKRLSYEINTICLISNNINQVKGLKVKYKSNKINNLYSSKITIKNIGNVNIEKQDLATNCPLSISTNGQFLLNKSNEIDFYPIHKANNITPIIEFDNSSNLCNHIIINFDYISRNDEFTCSIFHTGDISFDGILKEGEIISYKDALRRRKTIMRVLDFIIPIIVSVLSIFLTSYFVSGGATR